MADNYQTSAGSGGKDYRSDEIAGINFPAVKLTLGADNVDDGFVAAANPLPVVLTAGSVNVGDVDVLSLPALPTGSNTIGTVNLGTIGGVATDATLTAQSAKLPASLGSTISTASLSVVLASDHSDIKITLDGEAVAISGTVPISAASLPLPTGAATEATLATLALDATLTGGTQQTKITDGANVADVVIEDSTLNTTAFKGLVSMVEASAANPTRLNGKVAPLSCDLGGNLRVTAEQATSYTVISPTANNFKADSNIQVGDADVSMSNAVPIKPATGVNLDTSAVAGTVTANIGTGNLAGITADVDVTIKDSVGDSCMDDVNNALRVNIVAGSSAGTEFNEDAAHTTGAAGSLSLGVRRDADTSPVSLDGDYHAMIYDNAGALKVNVKTSALPSGAATAANQLPDGHNVTIDNAAGASAVNIQDGGNSITVDGSLTVLATQLDIDNLNATDDVVTVTGGAGQTADVKVTLDSEAVVLGAGTAAIGKLAANSGVDIGDVDVLSLPDGAKDWAQNQTTITKNVESASSSPTTLWDPTTTKKFVVTCLQISVSAAMQIKVYDSTDSTTTRLANLYLAANGGAIIPFDPPFVSAAADNILTVDTDTASNWSVTAIGFEI